MQSVLNTFYAAKDQLNDSTKPQWLRLSQWLDTICPLELDKLPRNQRFHFEDGSDRIQQILAGYRLESAEDYQRIDDRDLQEMLAIAGSITWLTIVEQEHRIIMELENSFGSLPVQTIQEIRENREQMIPVLIENLQNKVGTVLHGDRNIGNASFIILYLLTEFQAKESLPTIMEMISLPEPLLSELLGDAVTESLCKVFSQFATDQIELLDTIISNRQLNEYIRWEAVTALLFLVRDGRIERQEAVNRIRQYLQKAIDQGDRVFVSPLICELLQLSAVEAIDDIKMAFDRDMVDDEELDMRTVKACVYRSKRDSQKELDALPETGVADTIEELKRWACFHREPKLSASLELPSHWRRYEYGPYSRTVSTIL